MNTNLNSQKPKNSFMLYNEVYNLYIILFSLLNRFPKSQKFTLRQQIDSTFLDLLVCVWQYQVSQQENKGNYIKKMIYLFDKGKMLLRLSSDLNILPHHHYLSLYDKFETIGRLIGGLSKKL